jgi:hypothetical protein
MRTDRIKMHSILHETDDKIIVLTTTQYNNQYLHSFDKSEYQSYIDYYENAKDEITDETLKKAGYKKKERSEMLFEMSKKPTIDDFFDTYSVNEYRFRIGRDGTIEECTSILLKG